MARGSSFTLNVSGGGFCTEAIRLSPVGDRLEGLIHMPGGPVVFRARVAWMVAGDSHMSVRGRMGVCFVQIDRAFARDLEALIDGPGQAFPTTASAGARSERGGRP